MIKIKEAALSDIDRIMQIESRCVDKGEVFSRRRMRHLIHGVKGATFIAVGNSSELLGYMNLLFRSYRSAGSCRKSVRLYNIAVGESVRGIGVGGLLIEYLIDFARKNGFEKISLEVRADNMGAYRLYERAGFVKAALLRDYYGPGIDGYRMYLRN